MPGHQTIVGKIVVEYLKKYPDWFPTSTLARIIAKENPHTFDLVEDARSAIKYYRGKNGEVI